MSTDPNAYYPPNAPPQDGGGSGKLWLGLGIGCGLALLVCCGGVGGFFFVAGRAVSNAIKQDPTAAEATRREIAEIDVPPQLKPQGAIDFKVPFTDKTVFKAAVYADNKEQAEQEAIMFICEFPVPYDANNQQQMQVQMEQSMRQQGQGSRQLQISQSREVETELRGQKIKFMVQTGKDGQTNKEFRQVVGVFPGKEQSTVVIVVQLPADQLSDEQAEDLIRSIK